MASSVIVVASAILLLLLFTPNNSPLLPCIATTNGVGSLGGCGITAIYNFGDSFSDTGNMLAEFPHRQVGRFPYGITIHRATGRFSDGLLIIDHIAESAGVPYLNPYLKKYLDQSKGTNFAVAGVGVLSKNVRAKWNISFPFSQSSMDIQLHWLHQHLNHYFKDETARRNHLKSSLFVFSGGSGNDYWHIQNISGPPSLDQMKAIIPDVFAAIKADIKKLIVEYGASKLVVTGLYKAGCTVDEQLFHDSKPHCKSTIHAIAKIHNRVLRKQLRELRKEFPHVHIVYGDMWGPSKWLLDHYYSLGYRHPSNASCCGTQSINCGLPGAGFCRKPNEYMYWDANHLTDHSYRLISEKMIPQIASDLGCGGSHDHRHHPNKEDKVVTSLNLK